MVGCEGVIGSTSQDEGETHLSFLSLGGAERELQQKDEKENNKGEGLRRKRWKKMEDEETTFVMWRLRACAES